MAEPFSEASLPIAALVAVCIIIVFISLLAFQSKRKRPTREVQALGDHGEKTITATIFVEENGQIVRRSTRARKPAGETPVKTEETPPPTRRASKTPSKTPSAKESKESKETPVAASARDEAASPPRTRSRRTPRA